MLTSAFSRAASAYQAASVETSVHGASPHQLIVLLFDGLLQALGTARAAMQRKDIAVKGQQILRAVRFLEEGLKAGLDETQGGEVARNLRALYDYCITRLTHANLRNDEAALDEVIRLITPVAEAWKQIGQQAGGAADVASVAAASAAPSAPSLAVRPRGAYSTGLSAYSATV